MCLLPKLITESPETPSVSGYSLKMPFWCSSILQSMTFPISTFQGLFLALPLDASRSNHPITQLRDPASPDRALVWETERKKVKKQEDKQRENMGECVCVYLN